MKIASISDLHFHNWKEYSKTEDGVNSRYLYIEKTVREAYRVAKEKGCDIMCIPGDIFHVRGTLKTSLFNMVYSLFSELSKEMPTAMITGNHDMETYQFNEFCSSIASFDVVENIRVVNDAVYDLSTFTKGRSIYGKRFLVGGISYSHSIDDFKKTFTEMIDLTKPEVIMIHQGIDDFRPMASVPETKLTVSWLNTECEKYGANPIILCGHYHKPMSSGRVINVGAPLQHSFGGSGQDRGVWIVDVEEGASEFIPLNVAPKFHVCDEDSLKEIAKKEDLKTFLDSNYVKIKASSLKAIEKITKKHSDVDLTSLRIEIEKEFKGSYDVSIDVSSVDEMLRKYLSGVLEFDDDKVSSLMSTYARIVAGDFK